MYLRAVVGLFFIYLFTLADLSACTGILLTAEDGSIVTGRTVEFGENIEMSVAVIPRGFAFVGDVPQGKGLEYVAKYAAAGIYCFKDAKLMDGINEKGLVAAAFYFPGYAEYATVTPENQAKALSAVEFSNWILTQFATLDEVKAALPDVVIAPTITSGWGGSAPPLHYVVYDNTGKSLVIEPRGGTLKVYENEIGVITNSPTFDWQLTNLNNFINLSPYNSDSKNLRGLKLESFGEGSGMLGLPGDFTPPSRFVRAALFSTAAIPPVNSNETVDQAFHILNQFDIPYGSVRQEEGEKMALDYTLLTSVKEPQTLRYYYKSYADQTLRYVDLSEFNLDGKVIKDLKIVGEQAFIDVSSSLR